MRPAEKCAHGVPFFGDPYPVCRECDLIWEHECLAMAQQAVERHTRRIEAWGAPAVCAPCSASSAAAEATPCKSELVAEMDRVLGEGLKGRTHDVWQRAWNAGFRDARNMVAKSEAR